MKDYKIEKNVPISINRGWFDKNIPEYQAMLKMKVGDSFEFPRDRITFVLNSRHYFKKQGSPLCFTTTSRDAFIKDPKKLTGRVWRAEDNSRKTRKKTKR